MHKLVFRIIIWLTLLFISLVFIRILLSIMNISNYYVVLFINLIVTLIFCNFFYKK